jgi:hypothetical protein
MSIDQATRPRTPIGTIVVLVIAGFLYIGMMANFSEIQNPNTDAMGGGLASGFALVFAVAEWVFLGILLLVAGIGGAMPAWSAIVATILLPLSGFAAITAIGLLDHGASPLYQIVPGLVPPITAGYALWARLPSLHRVLRPLPTGIVAWVAVAILTLAPLPRYTAEKSAEPVQIQPQKSAEQILDEEEKQTRLAMVERYHKLTPDSPLWEWDDLFSDPEFGKQAVETARQLTHRQADAEQELAMGIGSPLKYYRALDLAATPALCAAASKFLIRNAKEYQPLDSNADFRTRDSYYLPYLDAIGWLSQSNCDLDDAVARLREVVGGFKQNDARDAYLAALPRPR